MKVRQNFLIDTCGHPQMMSHRGEGGLITKMVIWGDSVFQMKLGCKDQEREDGTKIENVGDNVYGWPLEYILP